MTGTVTISADDGHSLGAYRAGDPDAARGIVVVQEIFGVNHHIRSVCDRIAARGGFAVVAPALFDRVSPGIELGYSAEEVTAGRALRGQLGDAAVMADVRAAAALLTARPLGIVGFCFGGTVAWWGATRTALFSAASCWYGGGIAATREEMPACPVQMQFGEKDASIPMSDVDAIRARHPEAEIHVYAGAQHGFGCDERASFSPADADVAMRRTLEFLNRHLTG